MGSTEGFSVARGTGVCVVPSSAGTISTTWNSSRAISPRQIFREREEHHPITPPPAPEHPLLGTLRGGLGWAGTTYRPQGQLLLTLPLLQHLEGVGIPLAAQLAPCGQAGIRVGLLQVGGHRGGGTAPYSPQPPRGAARGTLPQITDTGFSDLLSMSVLSVRDMAAGSLSLGEHTGLCCGAPPRKGFPQPPPGCRDPPPAPHQLQSESQGWLGQVTPCAPPTPPPQEATWLESENSPPPGTQFNLISPKAASTHTSSTPHPAAYRGRGTPTHPISTLAPS